MFVPFTRGCFSARNFMAFPTTLSLSLVRCASSCRRRVGVGAPLFRRLVNRNNCVQKLRGTLIVTWQANRIDTPPPPRPRRFHPGARPSGPVVIIRFLSGGFDPRNIYARRAVVSRSRRQRHSREDAWSEKRITVVR